jgi:hypothetical protein
MPNFAPTSYKFGCALQLPKAVTGTTYTVTPEDFGKVITNRGAAGNLALTLPAPSAAFTGCSVRVFCVAAGTVTIACTSLLIVENNAAATSIAFSTASEIIGNAVTAVCTGSKWFIELHLANTASTHTIA